MGKFKKVQFGGVAIFITLCLGVYAIASHKKELSYQELQSRLSLLEQQKVLALQTQEDLRLQIESQSDPAWVEMCLKRNLGMVAQDQTKVYFSQE